MAEVGTYYITVMPSMSNFTSAVKKEMSGIADSAGKSFNTSFGDMLKGSAIGTMLGSLGITLGREIMGGLDVGIRRLDTLENFPKVMDALGFSATDASSSVQLIMDHLDGLPTATQDVVTLTQAIADSTGDLDLATKAALGFNDMMLANGASAGEVTQAQGVLNRVLGKGNATVAQWQSLQSVMPAQLAAVARELMGEGASVESLRDQLNDGTISWNDFLEAIVRLDQEGTDRMASFEEQARANSKGIGTALANVPNRIGAGWAKILGAIGREDISGVIDKMSYGVRDAMYRVGDAVEWLKWTILGSSIDESIGRIFGSVKEFFSETFKIEIPDLKNFIRGIVDLVEGGLKWIADHGEAVKVALGGIAGALIMMAGVKIGMGITQLPAILGGIVTALMANPFGLIVGGIGAAAFALWTFFTQTETGQQIWQNFCDLMKTTWEGLQEDWAHLMDVLSQEWESFKTWVDGIPDWWAGIVDGLKAKLDEWGQWWKKSWDDAVQSLKTACDNIVNGAKTAWENLKTATSQTWDRLKSATSQAWESLKTTIHEKVTAAKNAVTNAWNNVRSATSQAWENIKTSVSERAGAIKSAVTERFNALKSSVSAIWDGIKSSISDKITAAKNTVSDMISRIKGLFNFSWSLPRPSLPHINWHMESIAGLLSVPVFDGISWYAKGGVFDAASLIGVGERGPEAVLPLNDRTMGNIAGLIANKMDAAPTVVVSGNNFYVRKDSDIDAIADAIARRTERKRGARL